MFNFLITVAIILIGVGIFIDRKIFLDAIFSNFSRARNKDEIEKMEEKIRELERRLEDASQLEDTSRYRSEAIVDQGSNYIPQALIKQKYMYNQEPIMEGDNPGLPFTDIELGFQEIPEDFHEGDHKLIEVEEKAVEIKGKNQSITKEAREERPKIEEERPKIEEEKLKGLDVKFQEVYKESMVKTQELSLHSKIKIIQEYENRNKSIDEICQLMNMKKGEVLLLKKLYKK